MADTKISGLTNGATKNATDRIAVARSPFGSGDNRYLVASLFEDAGVAAAAVAAHEVAGDPHTQYLTAAEGNAAYQPLDSDLTTIAANITAAGHAVLDDADANAQLTTLGGAAYTGTGGVVRATSPVLVTPSGNTITATTQVLAPAHASVPGFSIVGDLDTGIGARYGNELVIFTGGASPAYFDNNIGGMAANSITFTVSGSGNGATLTGLDGNHILAQRNGANAQKFRVYGTTTGSKYAQLEHDGTNAILSASSGRVNVTGPLGLSSYTVATLPAVGAAGGKIFVSDETGGAVPAFSDATNWRRVTDRAIVA